MYCLLIMYIVTIASSANWCESCSVCIVYWIVVNFWHACTNHGAHIVFTIFTNLFIRFNTHYTVSLRRGNFRFYVFICSNIFRIYWMRFDSDRGITVCLKINTQHALIMYGILPTFSLYTILKSKSTEMRSNGKTTHAIHSIRHANHKSGKMGKRRFHECLIGINAIPMSCEIAFHDLVVVFLRFDFVRFDQLSLHKWVNELNRWLHFPYKFSMAKHSICIHFLDVSAMRNAILRATTTTSYPFMCCGTQRLLIDDVR